MTTSNQCGKCKYYNGRHKCVAFPEEIPPEFWVGSADHNIPVQDQYGEITFEPIDSINEVLKGGEGSGNWGHTGLEELWGGSSETGESSEEFLAHPGELRHSFDPETGEFDVGRHSRYCRNLEAEEYEEYRDKIDEYIEDEEPEGYEFEEPSDFIGDNGDFDPQIVDEFVEEQDMDWEEERDFKMEVAQQSAERRMELAEDAMYVAGQDVEATEMDWESRYESAIEEEIAELTFSRDMMFGEGEDSVNFHGDFIETVEERMEEFHDKETVAEQYEVAQEIEEEAEEIQERIEEEGDPTGELHIESGNLEKLSGAMKEHLKAEMPSDMDLAQERRNIMLGREERGIEIEKTRIESGPLEEQEGVSAVENAESRIGNGEQFFENYVSDETGWDGEVEVGLTTPEYRSSAEARKSMVNFGGVPDPKTVVHEYGHVMHRNSSEEVERAVNDLFEERTEDLELTEIYKGKEEYGYENAFDNHYTGKVYGHTQEGRYGDEVLAMGMQRIYDDPEEFYESDPEHYALTYGVMKGLF